MSSVIENLRIVKNKIASYCHEFGCDPEKILIIAVSKGQSIEKIKQLCDQGHVNFGENYLQELITKAAQLKDYPIKWHFLGHLQSNKLAKIVAISSEIHSVANLRHAKLIETYATQFNKTPFPIYIQLNSGDELQKNGLPFDHILRFADQIISTCPDLLLRGIMTVPPTKYSDENFNQTSLEFYTKIKQLSVNVGQQQLSLGMSQDMKLAIAAKTTCLRIGTGIFGKRQ